MISLVQIDNRIAELNKMLEAELAVEERIFRRVTEYFFKKAKVLAAESTPKELHARRGGAQYKYQCLRRMSIPK